MRIIRDPSEMRAIAEDRRRDGRKIALVPTMGYLHDGHLSLLDIGRARADILILSIFVNPTQFGPNEDLDRYPRDEQGDLAKARSRGVDYVFMPAVDAMYPSGAQTTVSVGELAGPLCGAKRPGHFAGVATIVSKLFHITRPHLAVFGEKDFQQLAVLRRMTADLDFGIEIASGPIVREDDGLAMSSRNRYLSDAERERALSLSRALEAADNMVGSGERIAGTIRDHVRHVIESSLDRSKSISADSIDYVEVLDAETLTEIERLAGPAVVAVAVRIGQTRLIDNRVLRV